jgi:hypothetical protein
LKTGGGSLKLRYAAFEVEREKGKGKRREKGKEGKREKGKEVNNQ